MALKDWKKEVRKTEITKDTVIIFRNLSTEDHVTIASDKKEGDWFVFGKDFNAEHFPTKAQAVTYAKNYMRSH